MPRRDRAKVIRDILNLLREKKVLHYREIMRELGLPSSTAYRYCVELETRFPDVIRYSGGNLILYGEWDKLPAEVRFDLIAKEIDEKLRKIRNNGLSEVEKAALAKDVEALRAALTKVKGEIDEIRRALR